MTLMLLPHSKLVNFMDECGKHSMNTKVFFVGLGRGLRNTSWSKCLLKGLGLGLLGQYTGNGRNLK